MVNRENSSPLRRDEGGTVEDLDQLCARVQVDPWNLATYTKGIYISARLKHEKFLEFFRTQCVKHCIVEDRFWLSWIEDKRRDCSDEDMISMYECAVDNEPSVEIWIAYVRFEVKRNFAAVNTARVRSLFERGLRSLGLHALDGPLLWSEYRQFEQDLVDKCPPSERGSQIERVRALFFRQLALPLAGLADLLDEYRVWESELPKEHRKPISEGENIHKIGYDAWERRKCFELKVQSEFDEMLNPGNMNSLWNDYINYELQCGEMDRISIVYLRALDDLGYERDDLWIRFSNHAIKVNEKYALWVCERSCRHMPRSVNIWINYLQMIASISTSSVEELVDVFDKAVTAVTDTSGLISLHITAADCLRRHHPESIEAFRRILLRQEDLLSKMGDLSSDTKGTYRLLTYWGKHELRLLMTKKGSHENYLEVIKKLVQRFISDYHCWLFIIDGVKNLDTSGNCSSNFMEALIACLKDVVEPKITEVPTPKTAHELIMWLFESSLQFVSIADMSEVYIDYVQTCGEVEDIKRAHMTVANHTITAETRCNGTTLSLKNIILRRDSRRRRHSESFSETSSDSGCGSYRTIKGNCRMRQDAPSMTVSSPKLSVRDFEFVTRATWDGNESADPSIAPAVPPSINMPPPPPSPMMSKLGSQFTAISVNNTPDTSPDFKYMSRYNSGPGSLGNFSLLPQPMISSHYTDVYVPGTNKRPAEEVDDSASMDSERSTRIQILLSSDNDVLQTWLYRGGEGGTLWISKLPENVDESEITSVFSDFTGFKSIRFFPTRGTCCIEFDTHDNAKRAKKLAADRKFSHGSVECDISNPASALYEDKVLFVKRISDIVALNRVKITEVLKGFFRELGHEPVNIRFPSTGADSDGEDSHTKVPDYCYVDFKEDDSARSIIDKILTRSGTLNCTMGDVAFDVSPSTPMFRKRARLERDNEPFAMDSSDERLSRTIYVGNLHPSTTRDELFDFFKKICGSVESAIVCTDGTGASKGYGYVCFREENYATAALLLDAVNMNGKELTVHPALKQQNEV
ncbi:pre-mRNA processing protein prp39-related domain containing protein [Babesia gibsoni]|uniref:Pre-mRNA processing protein prp39-related domain containing protein n=1 Tax=Babesia gibsoni TaxID=33632 RepID=A0AAD8PH19_BABGI|nr:pre-mRNA processing protein prp39-related domain containing protein [Babesia gibsoni]